MIASDPDDRPQLTPWVGIWVSRTPLARWSAGRLVERAAHDCFARLG